mgnify:FL=1|tara:strand:+ start:223 stop:441 length:219 start_codon:yes stop_codon:yes gene_type:complete
MDITLNKAASMQRKIKDLEHDQKIKKNMLLERDEEITELKKQIDKKQELIDFLNKQLKEERELNDKKPRRKK